MEDCIQITISGNPITLRGEAVSAGNGISVDDYLKYKYYSGRFKDVDFIAAVPKCAEHESPRRLFKRRTSLERAFKKIVVFIFDNLLYYERERLIQRNVYFVVSGKYVFLPFLVINATETDSPYRSTASLLPPAQYLLMWHLQKETLDGMNMNEIVTRTGMSQPSVSRALTQLASCGLVRLGKNANRTKTITFADSGKALWDKAEPHFVSPVIQTWYCDKLDLENWPRGGISALSHYSMLAPDPEETVVMTREQFNAKKQSILGLNRLDGDIIIEVWKYAPLVTDGNVDKLSLFLSLMDDRDPRVEKELEIMLNKIWSTV